MLTCALPGIKFETLVNATSMGVSNALHYQGSYASGKCQGNLNFFKVRELSGNFMLCQ